jgi:hypothetical protein
MTTADAELLNPIEAMATGEFESVFIPESLPPHETHIINTDATLYDRKDVKNFLGFQANIPAVITAADKRLLLVDIRNHESDREGIRTIPTEGGPLHLRADFLLISPEDWDRSSMEKGFKGVRFGEDMVFGRSDPKIAKRFALDSAVSRQHFRLSLQYEGLTIEDLDSTNGTAVMEADHSVLHEQTVRAVDRVARSERYGEPDERGPYGYLDGRPILGRRSPHIKGGIYLGGGPREAIAVSPETDPRIDAVYDRMTRKRVLGGLVKRALGGKPTTNEQLQTVFATVQEVMKYDGPAVEALSDQYRGDRVVSLGNYIEQGVGVCRHQGLLAAYLIERLIEDGKMKGSVHIERNTIPEYGGAHAWASYTDESGTDYVIDAAQSFVGTKKEARAQARTWDYYLPTI